MRILLLLLLLTLLLDRCDSFSLFKRITALASSSLNSELNIIALKSTNNNDINNDNDSTNIQLKRISKLIETWCGCHGLLYADAQPKDQTNDVYTWRAAPLSLLPLPYPYKAYKYVKDVQPIINKLIDKISRDRDFLINTLNIIAKTDEFTNNLLQIYEELDDSVVKESIQLGLHRSDYMLNSNDNDDDTADENPLQIEMNTIASSFGCLSNKVTTMHKYILERLSKDNLAWDTAKTKLDYPFNDSLFTSESIPDNLSTRMLAFGIAMAHLVYGNNQAIVLFVVQPGERNVADQRLLAEELWTTHNIRTEFITLKDIMNKCNVDANKVLKFNDDKKINDEQTVSVVYYRAGYTPVDYPSNDEWSARKLVEFSSAIKCPSIGYQLAGTKKVQQILCEDNMLERYLSTDESQLLRKCFAAQYSLGAMATKQSIEAMKSAINDGSKWVLKPQREGGGNNYYGKELSDFLSQHETNPTLSEYILMQRIFPKIKKSIFLRNGDINILPSINELGIYGTFLGDGSNKPLVNTYSGYLLRTKPYGVDEGGVATGYSVLNSIALLDKEIENVEYEMDDEELEMEDKSI